MVFTICGAFSFIFTVSLIVCNSNQIVGTYACMHVLGCSLNCFDQFFIYEKAIQRLHLHHFALHLNVLYHYVTVIHSFHLHCLFLKVSSSHPCHENLPFSSHILSEGEELLNEWFGFKIVEGNIDKTAKL